MPAAVIETYIQAKDGNRPHLITRAFTEDASLTTVIETDKIHFPARLNGRAAITDLLIRQFAKTYENVYTFCLAAPQSVPNTEFRCRWLVLMSEKDGGRARAGTGYYDWRFAASGLAERLTITIEVMDSLAPRCVEPMMNWAAALPYPWCSADQAKSAAPANAGVDGLVGLL